jgi:hypothetical protein
MLVRGGIEMYSMLKNQLQRCDQLYQYSINTAMDDG